MVFDQLGPVWLDPLLERVGIPPRRRVRRIFFSTVRPISQPTLRLLQRFGGLEMVLLHAATDEQLARAERALPGVVVLRRADAMVDGSLQRWEKRPGTSVPIAKFTVDAMSHDAKTSAASDG